VVIGIDMVGDQRKCCPQQGRDPPRSVDAGEIVSCSWLAFRPIRFSRSPPTGSFAFLFPLFVFRPLEIVFPAKPSQRFFRPAWQAEERRGEKAAEWYASWQIPGVKVNGSMFQSPNASLRSGGKPGELFPKTLCP
jgi:hypothetical protein